MILPLPIIAPNVPAFIKPPINEVMPLECFACHKVFQNGDYMNIRNLVRDTSSAYSWRWLDGHLHERNFEDIIFDGTITYALCERCDFFHK